MRARVRGVRCETIAGFRSCHTGRFTAGEIITDFLIRGGKVTPRGGREGVRLMADDDDWVGEPPEGRHTRDRAKPGFWDNQWQAAAAGSVLFVLVVIVLLLALL